MHTNSQSCEICVKLVYREQIVIAAFFHPKFLVSFPRIPFEETIKLRIRGLFRARKNSCRTCHEVMCHKALWVGSARGTVVSLQTHAVERFEIFPGMWTAASLASLAETAASAWGGGKRGGKGTGEAKGGEGRVLTAVVSWSTRCVYFVRPERPKFLTWKQGIKVRGELGSRKQQRKGLVRERGPSVAANYLHDFGQNGFVKAIFQCGFGKVPFVCILFLVL